MPRHYPPISGRQSINTALGITARCIAIIFFNYFSNRIDAITQCGIDEAGFSISKTLALTT
ncbi:MAG: hypothetical protein IPP83_00145 [Flavobacteriales bacterium]|nr:hypothetical protein [Flavobacteriales bacterium]